MAEIKSYPNNVNTEIGAEHVMRWHHGRTSGVFGAIGELTVAALTTPAMAVTVTDGDGWLADQNGNGIHFWCDVFATTAALLQLSIDTADGVLNRIDRVIVEWSTPNYTQLPEIRILKGISAVNPVAPTLTNNASLRQISLARIHVAAGTLAITAGMIHDERFDSTVCGVVTENVLVDTTVAVAQLNAVIAEAQALVNALTGGAVPNHATTHAAAGDDPVSPQSIGAELVSLRFSDTEVAPVAFSADSTYEDYPFRAAVPLSGVTADHDVDVRFDALDAVSGVFAPVAATYNGGVHLYASEVPEATVSIPRIICSR